ncbi:MAG TPA: polysaccharide deacetylase family protein [Chthoniobacterales bacterium]|nr:polysaccharide deacetylase family protein [Chthoniobacterales bacterium]
MFDRSYFEEKFETEDPWDYGSDYEQTKYRQTLSLLQGRTIGRAVEVGCAEGHFTTQLASCVRTLLACDISSIALQRAAARCAGRPNVTFAQFDIRENHLFDNYDLIVCSEVLGYLPSAAELERILQRLSLSLKRDGLLLMANAKAVADEPTGRGFDWGRPFGAHTIAEAAAASGLETIAALTAPLYEIRLLRRGKPRAIEPGVALMGWLSPSAAASAKGTPHANVGYWPGSALPVLMYHRIAETGEGPLAPYRVSPSAFEAQLRLLKDHGYIGLSLEDFQRMLFERRAFPHRSVLLTFDDAYQDFGDAALPLLKSFGFPAAVFVVTDQVGRTAEWDQLYGPPAPLLDWRALQQLSSDNVAVGSHGRTHRRFRSLSPEEVVGEGRLSRALLQDRLGQPVRALAYPHGDTNAAVATSVRACGYRLAFTTREAFCTHPDDPMLLPRVMISGLDGLLDFSAKLTGQQKQSPQPSPEEKTLTNSKARKARRTRRSIPAVSVLIPTRNRLPLLKRLVAALAEQDLPKEAFEILVVSDGGTEGAGDWSDIHSSTPGRLLKQPHRGAASARNHAIREAKADIILMLDDDLIVGPDCVSAHLKFHDSFPQPMHACLGFMTWSEQCFRSPLVRYLAQGDDYLSWSYVRSRPPDDVGWPAFWTGHLSAKRQFLLEHGVFDEDHFRETMGEDLELGRRLEAKGLRLHFRESIVAEFQEAPSFREFAQRQWRRGRSRALLKERRLGEWNVGAADAAGHYSAQALAELVAATEALEDRSEDEVLFTAYREVLRFAESAGAVAPEMAPPPLGAIPALLHSLSVLRELHERTAASRPSSPYPDVDPQRRALEDQVQHLTRLLQISNAAKAPESSLAIDDRMQKPVALCTIASNNYLPKARVLIDSYLSFHPGAEAFVCVVDRPVHDGWQELSAKIIPAEELGIPGFDNMAFRYSALELNTAAKPFFLEYLRDQCGIDRVFYLDPDVLILDPLGPLQQALHESAIVLSPHVTEPVNEGTRAGERQFLRAGVFNLGFLGIQLNASTHSFLDWWKDRLMRFCVDDIPNGLFVDQIWMNLAPCFVDSVRVVRDRIYNLAWWNLSQRPVESKEGRWCIDGERIGFIHFSGFPIGSQERITKHRNDITLLKRPDLRPCFDEYSRRVDAAGQSQFGKIPYGYGTFRDSDVSVIPAFRRLLQRLDPAGCRWPHPFELEGPDSFGDWLAKPLEFRDGFLTRAALAYWEHRADLVRAFKSVCGDDLIRYVDWLTTHGEGTHGGLHPRFLEGVAKKPQRTRVLARESWGHLLPHDPFADHATNALLDGVDLAAPGPLAGWLNEPAGDPTAEPAVSNLGMLLHSVRLDLQQAFPEPLGRDRAKFLNWYVTSAKREYDIHDELFPGGLAAGTRPRLLHRTWRALSKRLRKPPASRAERRLPIDFERPPKRPEPKPAVAPRGINLAGYFESESGVSELARTSEIVLRSMNLPVARISLDQDYSENVAFSRINHPEGVPFSVTLFHANAAEMPSILSTIPIAASQGNYQIGYWFWELLHLPLSLASGFQQLDELWASSRFCEAAFRALATVPIRYVPPHVQPALGRADRSRFGLEPDRFYFFSAFDVRSTAARKNPLGTIEALSDLLRKTSRKVGLVLKIHCAEADHLAYAEMRERISGLPIVLRNGTTSRSEYGDLLASCDAVLSLHRSEGLGLIPIEALYQSKPVVATEYGGVTDFLDETTSFPVKFTSARLEQDYGPYPKGAVWAEPSIESAVEQMKRVIENPQLATDRTRRGHEKVTELYGHEAATRRFTAELDRIFASLQ